MDITTEITQAWGWIGIRPVEVVGHNDFGNLIIKDVNGSYWRLCPEDPYCKVIAQDRAALNALSTNQEFLKDWHMPGLVAQARERFGALLPGYKYCLKIPGVLGGEYGGENLASISLKELISVSGHIAKEIEGMQDGTQIQFRIIE